METYGAIVIFAFSFCLLIISAFDDKRRNKQEERKIVALEKIANNLESRE